MWRSSWMGWLAVLAIGVIGCGGSDDAAEGPRHETSSAADQTAQGPAEAVAEFLEAVRSGDDDKFTSMLTARARRKRASTDIKMVPQGSDTAQFEVGEVEYVGEDGARVVSTLSDLDANAERKTERIVWILRREPEGWRIAALAVNVNEEPLVMSFEDPEDMLQKRDWVAEQTSRSDQRPDLQAQGGGDRTDPFRR